MSAYVIPFSRISREDGATVGGKGANLGEMYRNNFPVPNGFCVTAQAYKEVIEYNKLDDDIRLILKDLDVENSRKLEEASKKVKKLIVRADIPTPLSQEIIKAYLALKPGIKHPLVAVRSSATAEDLPEASFAGQQATFLNIMGEANVIQAVREAWASLFEPRAIYYRQTKGFDHFKVALAVPIQLMVQSDVSGIMFTINPVTNDKRRTVIEAVWGLGEMIVQGAYTPDHYEVNKDSGEIYTKIVNFQEKQLIRVGTKTKETGVPKTKQDQPKLNDDQIATLNALGVRLQQHYMFPQDSEWAMEDGKIYLVQTRPITTIQTTGQRIVKSAPKLDHMKLIVKGDSASPGIAWGRPVLVKSVKEIGKVQTGDVLVTSMTTPDFVPAMKKAVAIVTDKGGQTSHAAIVSRELGVPAVVGTHEGTKILPKLSMVTINGATGEVFEGKPREGGPEDKKMSGVMSEIMSGEITTATKVYVNLGEPDLAARVATKNVDGVGLLRAEFMMAQIGYHPKKLIQEKKQSMYIEKLADGLEKFCSAFGYRPIIYRASDFKTNEYRNLIGGQAFEPQESNPMLGYRGAYRYISDERVFELELEAIKEVRNKRGHKNLWLMIPFVRSPQELAKVKRIVSAAGLYRSPTFKLLMMVEIPANVILLEQFAAVGIDGVSIGSNDLTMLTLGIDRDNETVAPIFDERDPAVMWMLEQTIKKAHKLDLMVGICGQAPSVYPELTRKLVEWGITSVSVSPDVIERTRQIVYEAEKELIGKK